jgi:Peptidase family M1 domain
MPFAFLHFRTRLRRSSSTGWFRLVESDYSHFVRCGVAALALSLFCNLGPALGQVSDKSARELYDALLRLRIDPGAVYEFTASSRVELRRADLLLSLEQGKLAFFQPLNGRITGAVFMGRGHALAAPRGVVEKQQMARFLGAPLLDQDFTSVWLRFSDDTAADLLRQFQRAELAPEQDADFAARWDNFAGVTNPPHALRLVFDSLSHASRPFFYAVVDGTASGPFDFVFDSMRDEPVLLGQSRKSGDTAYYDVWASYKYPGISPAPTAFRALRYSIDGSLLSDMSLRAQTQIRFRAETGGERLLVFQLSRMLNVTEVTAEDGRPLMFFQNEGVNLRERSTRGNDRLYVILPDAPPQGTEFSLRFRYQGNVVEDAGNGVLFVGARESWYPHLGDAADFADYDVTLRWPRRLRIVCTGEKLDEHEDGEFRVAHWRTEKPQSVAGFNIGEYASTSLASGTHSIEVYANRQLEQALTGPLNNVADIPQLPSLGPEGSRRSSLMIIVPPPPSPADALKQLGRDIDASIRFYESFSGPFPFRGLRVSQIPGRFGQGWPGLLYLSTFSFLPPAVQQRAGLSESTQELFTELVPFHEVAHQWWGNLVGWESYRDQWIDEGIANYLALLFADSQKNANHSLRVWLTRYRQHLMEKVHDSDLPGADIGSLDIGNRLSSSKSPSGFEQVIYSKATWVIHMLREMLRQPESKNPDARFVALLRTLATNYAYRALSTDDLRREVEAVMTPSMDLEGGRSMEWFFEEWVRGTGVPRYRVEFSSHQTEKGYLVRGKLFQEDVPRSFVAPVPLYANAGTGHAVRLGTVIAAGPETSFRFISAASPRKILIDPHMTLLCVTE